MGLFQCLDRFVDQFVGHHHLHLPLGYLLDGPSLAEVGLAALQRAELALAQGLPAAAVIGADAPAAHGEHSLLHGFQMALRNVKAQLVHQVLRMSRMAGSCPVTIHQWWHFDSTHCRGAVHIPCVGLRAR
ncbi:hypothetical protein D3C81_1767460 [compost metagenome]